MLELYLYMRIYLALIIIPFNSFNYIFKMFILKLFYSNILMHSTSYSKSEAGSHFSLLKPIWVEYIGSVLDSESYL